MTLERWFYLVIWNWPLLSKRIRNDRNGNCQLAWLMQWFCGAWKSIQFWKLLAWPWKALNFTILDSSKDWKSQFCVNLLSVSSYTYTDAGFPSGLENRKQNYVFRTWKSLKIGLEKPWILLYFKCWNPMCSRAGGVRIKVFLLRV